MRKFDRFGVLIETRPWGEFHTFTENQPVTCKILMVHPGKRLSLQYHMKREEFWVVLDGNPMITIGKKRVTAKPGDRFIIPRGTIHRIDGSKTGTRILEIARGFFDEDDIVRLQDDHGRV